MPEHRIPQQILYGELCEGERNRGRQKLRYKDTLKQNLKKGNIDPDTWEEQAKDRPQWRAAVYGSKSAVEEMRLAQYQRTHERRHSQPAMTSFQCFNCMRICRSNDGLAAHRRACSVTNTACVHAPESRTPFNILLTPLPFDLCRST